MKWRSFFLIIVILTVIVGCGTASVASNPPHPTTLQVERATYTINYFSPFSRTITSVENVQILYNKALTLPKASGTGAHSCPASTGLIYSLRFLQYGTLAQQMTLEPSGCAFLLVSKNDMRVVSEKFIALFAQIMGVSLSQILVSPLPSKTKPTP